MCSKCKLKKISVKTVLGIPALQKSLAVNFAMHHHGLSPQSTSQLISSVSSIFRFISFARVSLWLSFHHPSLQSAPRLELTLFLFRKSFPSPKTCNVGIKPPGYFRRLSDHFFGFFMHIGLCWFIVSIHLYVNEFRVNFSLKVIVYEFWPVETKNACL